MSNLKKLAISIDTTVVKELVEQSFDKAVEQACIELAGRATNDRVHLSRFDPMKMHPHYAVIVRVAIELCDEPMGTVEFREKLTVLKNLVEQRPFKEEQE